jgi:hypothetical protein
MDYLCSCSVFSYMVLSGTIRASGYMIMIMIMPNVLESYAAAVYSAAVYGSRMSNLLESGNIKVGSWGHCLFVCLLASRDVPLL